MPELGRLSVQLVCPSAARVISKNSSPPFDLIWIFSDAPLRPLGSKTVMVICGTRAVVSLNQRGFAEVG